MSTFSRLYKLQQLFIDIEKPYANIEAVLDIGAYRGGFTKTINNLWPKAKVWQIEADERQQQYLNNPIISLLGNANNKIVDFYTLPEDKDTSGSSIFKENSIFYKDALVIKKTMTTLDDLTKIHNFDGNWAEGGLIKIDTQGSELMILEGARDFIKFYKPRFFLLKCSITEFNKGSPKIANTIKALDKINYHVIDIFDPIYMVDTGSMVKMNVLFERNTIAT
jgi:FkbM family methyltransferase